ncbi:MAG: hypothetical protein K8L97_19640 [Anaerolineae bacterium]|nr:hypothetical protein [Anaerolineae bacterium]
MMQLMEKALAEIQKLPETEQESLAAWILDELASERRWSESFAASEDLLAQLAAEALIEHRAGKTQPLNPDEL